MQIWIKNVDVVTVNENDDILYDTNVYISGNKISHIGDVLEDFDAEEVIDAKGQVLMPGLINSHTHSGMSLMRNYGNDHDLHEWLEKFMFPIEALFTEEDVVAGSTLSMVEMIQTGTTSFIDMYYELEGVAKAVEKIGLRALLTRGMMTPDPGHQREKEMRDLYHNWNGKANDRIRCAIGPHAVYTTTDEFTQRLKDLGDELGCGFHIHIGETKHEFEVSEKEFGLTPTAYYDKFGMLDDRTIAAHCIWLTEEDRKIFRDRGVTAVHNPSSNMKLASGFLATQEYLDMGINVALGTDGSSSNNNLNMFEEMHLASLLGKVSSGDPKAVTAKTTIRMATINGAKALGREHELGSVEVGKLADVILVDFHNAHHYPKIDIEAAIVYSTQGSDVTTTICDGEILMRDRKLLTVDVEKALQDAEATWKDLQIRRNQA